MIPAGTVILPTHQCFDDALELLLRRFTEDRTILARRSLVLVHGICLMPSDEPDNAAHAGELFVHAWVEEDDRLVWDAGLIDGVRVWYSCAKTEYYEKLLPRDCTRYGMGHAFSMALAQRFHGPWKPEYQALCKKINR